MADKRLKKRIFAALREGKFSAPDEIVHVSDSDALDDSVHVVIVSKKFAGKHMGQQVDIISKELTSRLPPEDWREVSLMIGVTPESVNGHSIEEIKAM